MNFDDEELCFGCETNKGDYDNGYCRSCYDALMEQAWDEEEQMCDED